MEPFRGGVIRNDPFRTLKDQFSHRSEEAIMVDGDDLINSFITDQIGGA
jgi:hypothetical protein